MGSLEARLLEKSVKMQETEIQLEELRDRAMHVAQELLLQNNKNAELEERMRADEGHFISKAKELELLIADQEKEIDELEEATAEQSCVLRRFRRRKVDDRSAPSTTRTNMGTGSGSTALSRSMRDGSAALSRSLRLRAGAGTT